ncbi:MAG: hypothetical protein HXO19_11155 [Prevotella shahii]|uniref:hypothetical protein n=1 Tax=Hoylesella shahii TaxID=228603 RepID=UPI001CACE36C|nr:hypothetical protein [Hoylesella shahii]MBF1591624.1 hypothetical protein [Hoylesella shahii]
MTTREINKVHSALMREHSIFYADMICRAIQDNTINEETFVNGIEEIYLAYQEDKDEYIPEGWEDV